MMPPSGNRGGGKGGGGRGGDGGGDGGGGGGGGAFGGEGGGKGGRGGGEGEMRFPQSVQSVPGEQFEYSAPGPPSLQTPLLPNA